MAVISEIISTIEAGNHLSRQQMREVFEQIMTGRVEADRMGEFLKALAAKKETVEEIAGAADVMNDKVTRVRCEADCIDTCGTGGDGISTYNVSTTAAIIAAGAGATVAKHGNRTNTRVSGSAEAIAELGVNLDADVATLERCLDECGIAFLYAPNLHPAMKYAGPVRKKLGMRTIFNLLGPLTNPAGAKRQVLGTSKPELTETLARVLAARDAAFAWVVNGHNGLCDLTITGQTRVTEVRGGQISTFTIHPNEVGFDAAPLDTLLVDSPQASAHAIRAILEGQDQGPRRQHALLNAGAAIVVAGLADDLKTAVNLAARAVDTGVAVQKLNDLVKTSHT
ncbi:MAG: anthranilate phosphoribosyltransferase [Planctomycetota bacterium]|nr:MAG: anthranilate phosphoribosyltransferase [Planctomycetota bacterium]